MLNSYKYVTGVVCLLFLFPKIFY